MPTPFEHLLAKTLRDLMDINLQSVPKNRQLVLICCAYAPQQCSNRKYEWCKTGNSVIICRHTMFYICHRFTPVTKLPQVIIHSPHLILEISIARNSRTQTLISCIYLCACTRINQWPTLGSQSWAACCDAPLNVVQIANLVNQP